MKSNIPRKLIVIITILSLLITTVNALFYLILPALLAFRKTSAKYSSVGIIGGADGPTSILISNSSLSPVINIFFAVLSAAGILYLLATKRAGKK
jgi:hypothetical protein